MKKLLTVLLVVIVAAGLWWVANSSSPESRPSSSPEAGKQTALNTRESEQPSSNVGSASASDDQVKIDHSRSIDEDTEDDEYFDDRPATEIYKSADEAFEALKKASLDYDDIVLEQFVDIAKDCSWCDELYEKVKEIAFAPDTDPDQRSFFTEVLATSGRVEDVKTLVEAIENETNTELADIYAESLELAVGGDDTVRYLSEKLNSENDLLQESVVAAITNQGSRLAAEVLYKHTVEKGDPDGYYSLGIGLGELVPEEEALPYLRELALKRDAYSHLAVKALLNNGTEGLRAVMSVLATSSNPEFDKEMLKDAIDHVSYEEEAEAYLKELLKSNPPKTVADFAREILADFALEEEEYQDDQEQ
ncbi:MAG: hypothetical protein D6719_12145 [Candidatus Dadabacteria bacterium]|nr:MAG: hypothetical protein D6719_12145 [Candidatus Dadabacteria bacterium]